MAQDTSCGVRDKYAKRFDSRGKRWFRLHTAYMKPGLLTIFDNEDEKSFQNWHLDVGSGLIRETIDHQINTPVLEISGHHDGSVYMVCPPDPNGYINVNFPFITLLMKDMHGYSSVEFTVLDSLGYSRKIHAKNFRSKCTIGELDCEIPMRLSPTWNYACVNLNSILRDAFGTKLVSVQRIKINANARVHRVYFSDEVYGFQSLPPEYRIKLELTPRERKEIKMYEEFLTNAPTGNESSVPWALPKLHLRPELLTQSWHAPPKVEAKGLNVFELPKEVDTDKYSNIKPFQLHRDSNTGMLREMLAKSLPPSKVLVPTLSLIYPNKKGQVDFKAAGEAERDKPHERRSTWRRSEVKPGYDPELEKMRRIKGCVDGDENRQKTVDWDFLQFNDDDFLEEYMGEDHPEDEMFHPEVVSDHLPGTEFSPKTASHKEIYQSQHDPHQRKESQGYLWQAPTLESQDEDQLKEKVDFSKGDLHPTEQTPQEKVDDDNLLLHSCDYSIPELIRYMKQREVLGDYDLFSGKLRNPQFLVDEVIEEAEEEEEDEADNETVNEPPVEPVEVDEGVAQEEEEQGGELGEEEENEDQQASIPEMPKRQSNAGSAKLSVSEKGAPSFVENIEKRKS